MEEMMEDTLDSGVLGEDEDEMEEEAQGEVDKVLYDLTDGKCHTCHQQLAQSKRRLLTDSV